MGRCEGGECLNSNYENSGLPEGSCQRLKLSNIPRIFQSNIRTLYNFKTSKHRSVTCQHRSDNLHFFRHRSVIFSVILEFLFLVNFYNTDLQALHRSDKINIDLKSSKKIYIDL